MSNIELQIDGERHAVEAGLLAEHPHPTDDDIDRAMRGNLGRCGTYVRIRRAIHRAAEVAGREGRGRSEEERR